MARNFEDFAKRLNMAARKADLRTPAELSNASGLNRITLGSYMRGERAASLEACVTLARVLNVSPAWLHSGKEGGDIDGIFRGAKRDINQPANSLIKTTGNIKSDIAPTFNMENTRRQIPLYSAALAGPDGSVTIGADIMEMIEAPGQVAGVPDAFAVRVSGESMEPRYNHGETVYIHPREPVRKGDYVVAQIAEDGNAGAIQGYIKRLISIDDNHLVVEQLNPKKILKFSRNRVKSVNKIVLAG